MGQEMSWPCTSREDQSKRLAESKYDFDFMQTTEGGEVDDELRRSVKLQKISKIEKIISNKEYLTKVSTTPSHSHGGTPYTFTDDSINESELTVMVVCEEIDDFNYFISKYLKKYNHELVPSFIAPHPFQNKAIVIFQSINTVPNFNLAKQHNFLEFEKDLRAADPKQSYQLLIKFFQQCADQGLDFLGYYLDTELKYHFIFYERDDIRAEKPQLQFETIVNLSPEGIESSFRDATSYNLKFKGVITLLGDRSKSQNFSFAIYEKKKLSLEQPIIIDIPADSLGSESISKELSRKIEIGCQSDVVYFIAKKLTGSMVRPCTLDIETVMA